MPRIESPAPSAPVTASRSCELHLLAESRTERGAGLRVLAPPAGLSFLVPGRAPLALKRRRPRRACLTLEPVARDRTSGRRARLLVLLPPGLHARWNALPAPPVLLLRVGDALRLPGGATLHLSEYVAAEIGAPPAELVGRPCGVCRQALTAEASVLCCRGCGEPVHRGQTLDCAALAETCPACDGVLHAGGEYAWLPEGGEVPRG